VPCFKESAVICKSLKIEALGERRLETIQKASINREVFKYFPNSSKDDVVHNLNGRACPTDDVTFQKALADLTALL